MRKRTNSPQIRGNAGKFLSQLPAFAHPALGRVGPWPVRGCCAHLKHLRAESSPDLARTPCKSGALEPKIHEMTPLAANSGGDRHVQGVPPRSVRNSSLGVFGEYPRRKCLFERRPDLVDQVRRFAQGDLTSIHRVIGRTTSSPLSGPIKAWQSGESRMDAESSLLDIRPGHLVSL